MSDVLEQYYEGVLRVIDKIKVRERGKIEEAARVISDSIEKDKLIHVFGTGGHSSIGAEEMFWRAGGLVPINAILDPGVSLAHGALRSTLVERTPGYAKAVLDYYRVKKDDVIIIVNAYGINSVTIDSALESKKRGAKVIAVTSSEFCKVVPEDHPARHPTKKNLFEIADIFVDCHVPPEDAIVKVKGFEQKVAPVSTIANAFVVNAIVAKTVDNLVKKGVSPPVWMSANMPGGDEANKKYFEKYFERIKHL